jgi:hypothetical protein
VRFGIWKLTTSRGAHGALRVTDLIDRFPLQLRHRERVRERVGETLGEQVRDERESLQTDFHDGLVDHHLRLVAQRRQRAETGDGQLALLRESTQHCASDGALATGCRESHVVEHGADPPR